METERPHRSNSNNSSSTSELFVCFTSRLSSSSMKLSSKSLLSPSRTSRDPPPQISLSTSLSRRLRSNGSIKGGGQASPMFPATATVGGKRRGCGFENPEPSSPKVTCIGQVRVKTKKQGKKMRVTRSKSKRRTIASTSEASFRRTSTEGGGQITNSSDLTRQNSSSSATYMKQQHRNNQKWVHLPLTICEAFRELNCFIPCRSSCMRDKGDKGHHHHHHHHHDGGREGSSCGAAFARWLHLALQEGKEREIEVVMREEENEVVEDYDHDDDDDGGFGGRSHRRHVFEDIDIDVVEGKKEQKEGEEEEKGRVSICIPPKNALLLMRCRSDPVKMAALANRFWDSPVHKEQHQHQDGEEEEEEVEEEEEEENNVVDDVDKQEQEQVVEMEEGEEVLMQTEEERNSISERETEAGFVNIEEHNEASSLMEKPEEEVTVQESHEIESRTNAEFSEEARESNNQLMEEKEATEEIETEQVEEEEEEENHNQDENFSCVSTLEPRSDLDKPEETSLQEEQKQEKDESSELYSVAETLTAPQQNDEAETEKTTMPEPLTEAVASEEEQQQKNVAAETQLPPPPPPQVTPPANEESELNNELGSEERETGSNGEEREAEMEREKEETLPECLLLMMCEPKLSMEVSKETWVCSTDFIRWLPERPAGKNSGTGRKVHAAVEAKNSVEKKTNGTAALPPVQPGRSSCSFPAAPGLSMAAMIEQRLAAGPKSNGGYEPFVLTRCKSEPMRTTGKLAADACFWKKPHAPPPTLGVGAPAGVGF